jgi:hypothetical protein
MLSHLAIANRKLEIPNCQGGFELPTSAESFRGCSTCCESGSRDRDSFLLLGIAQYLAPLLGSSSRAALPLEIRRFALWYAYDRDDVERVERQGLVSNRCSGAGLAAQNIDQRHIEKCQGGESNSRPRAYESPALPLSYPGANFFATIPSIFASTNPECFQAPLTRHSSREGTELLAVATKRFNDTSQRATLELTVVSSEYTQRNLFHGHEARP